MSLIHAFLLGLLQGATEFLPVSSSGHLVLVPWFLGWPAPGLVYDALVHWGTAVAVVAYFWREWAALLGAAWRAVRRRSLADPQARLLALLILGTIPGAVIGWLLEDFFAGMFNRPAAASAFLLVTAAVLALSERFSSRERGMDHLSWVDVLAIGLAQAAAILPGLSRSGMTIAAGMGRGLRRESAARFSFLLSTPIILGAGLLQVWNLVQAGALAAQAPALVVGFLSALATGLACIHYLLRYLQRYPLYPFAVYCAGLGVLGLIITLR